MGRVRLDYPVTRTTKQKLQSIGRTQKSSLIAILKFPKAEILYIKHNNNNNNISKEILQECKCRKKKICMAWTDHQKAFDRVPHSWIIKSLELTGLNNKVISFSKKVMSYWRTCMCLHTENKLTETEDIKIQCGI